MLVGRLTVTNLDALPSDARFVLSVVARLEGPGLCDFVQASSWLRAPMMQRSTYRFIPELPPHNH
jgi:hypothetical protein